MALITTAAPQDGGGILEISKNVTVFEPEEVDCVAELWGEYLHTGAHASGYYFVVARQGEQVQGFACYGPRALTEGTYDLYWIAVDKGTQGSGVGRELICRVEQDVADRGGRLVVVETSGLEKYIPTRRFYAAVGYLQEAVLKDFYKPGDDLVIFTKHVGHA